MNMMNIIHIIKVYKECLLMLLQQILTYKRTMCFVDGSFFYYSFFININEQK